ncbi:MAG TPA: tetratricopeptide repeat protein [Planctomycetota bacterium]|nr:tetratricopeptide repeat protein [Planctomycetota bacterium]
MNFRKEFDVIVAGAGVAGVAAALECARAGRKTARVEKSILTGGLATSGLIAVLPDNCSRHGDPARSPHGRDVMKKAILFSVAFLLIAACARAQDTYDEAFARGEGHYEKGLARGEGHYDKAEFDKAIKAFTEAIRLVPESAIAYMRRGMAYLWKGDSAVALKDLNKALELQLHPSYWRAYYYYRGGCHLGQRTYDKAIADLTKSLALGGEDAYAYNFRARAYWLQGDLDNAFRDLNKSIALQPDEYYLYFNRAWVYQARHDYDKALKDVTRAIDLSPERSRSYRSRGNLYFDMRQFDKAILDYEKALTLQPDDPHARIWLFLARQRLKKSALPDLVAFRAKLKNDKWIHNIVRLYVGEITPAMCLAAAADKDPKKANEQKCDAHFYIAQFYLIRGDKKHASEHLKKCIETDVKDFIEYTSAKAELKRLERTK